MPTIASNKQPTIAIITAQYCEKLAVDSMLENKETFVRYTTVGKCLRSADPFDASMNTTYIDLNKENIFECFSLVELLIFQDVEKIPQFNNNYQF